jgi:hypothetical protein
LEESRGKCGELFSFLIKNMQFIQNILTMLLNGTLALRITIQKEIHPKRKWPETILKFSSFLLSLFALYMMEELDWSVSKFCSFELMAFLNSASRESSVSVQDGTVC